MTDNPDLARKLLERAEDALHSLAIELLAVQPQLDKPFTDRSGLSPWKNSVGAQGSRAYQLAAEIREHLGVPYRACRSRACGAPPLELADVIARAVAGERERILREVREMEQDPAWGVDYDGSYVIARVAGRIGSPDAQPDSGTPEARVGHLDVEYAVFWGGDDPDESAGHMIYDDEAEAFEMMQWVIDSQVARRTVTRSAWERVENPDA